MFSINKSYWPYRRSIMLIFFIVVSFAVSAQKNDRIPVNQKLLQAREEVAKNPIAALKLLDSILSIARQSNDSFGIAKALILKGEANIGAGNAVPALENLEASLSVINKINNRKLEIDAWLAKGSAFNLQGYYQKAFEACNKSLDIAKAINDTLSIAKGYSSIAGTMADMKYYPEAAKYTLQAYEIFKRLKKEDDIARMYSNLSAIYIGQNKYSEARNYALSAVKICDSINKYTIIADAYVNLGISYDYLNKKDSALFFYHKALPLATQFSNLSMQTDICNNIGVIYQDRVDEKDNNHKEGPDSDSSEKYFRIAFDLATKSRNYYMINIVGATLSDYYAGVKKDYKKAYEYDMLSSIAKDSLYDNEKAKALAELTVKFETKETEDKNRMLQKENDLQKLRLQRKNIFTYGSLIAVIITAFFALLWVRQNKIKTKQQRIALEQKQLRAQMDPHFLFNSLNSIQHYIVHNDVILASKYLSEFASLMRRTLDISSGAMISLKDEIDYLENYLLLEKMRFENKLNYQIICSDEIDKNKSQIPPMIVQPFVENAIHHGLRYLKERKGNIIVSFGKEHNHIICKVDDNGIGILASRKLKEQLNEKHISQGITLTQKRLSLIGKAKKTQLNILIEDKSVTTGEPGTLVIIKFPSE